LTFSQRDYGDFCLLGYNIVYSVENQPEVRRNISPLSSGLKNKPKKDLQEAGSACYLLHAGLLLGLSFDPKDGGNMLLRNLG
jgi:hypothetical protein